MKLQKKRAYCRTYCIAIMMMLTSTAMLANEAALYEAYRAIVDHSPSSQYVVTENDAFKLFNDLKKHPIANFNQLPTYDPNGLFGFCFGRSMAVHLLARSRGIAKPSIRKLFIIGDLRSSAAPEWRFHVTTLVRGKTAWFAIDPIFATPLPFLHWIAKVKELWDPRDRAYLYLTEADAILPAMDNVPATQDETGTNIIELAFQPQSQPFFFPAMKGWLIPIYKLPRFSSDRYFSSANDADNKRFNFEQITINDLPPFSYNHFFRDLLASFPTPGETSFDLSKNDANEQQGGLQDAHATGDPKDSNNLGSMRVDILLGTK